MATNSDEFPRYLMLIGDKKMFLPLQEAGRVFDSGMCRVDTAGFVLEADWTMRKMTKEEERLISDTAEEYSADK